MTTLEVWLDKQPIGQVTIDVKEENYRFEYIDEWKKEGYTISPHLPLEGHIPSGAIKRFLENLLPEGKGLEDLSAFTHLFGAFTGSHWFISSFLSAFIFSEKIVTISEIIVPLPYSLCP